MKIDLKKISNEQLIQLYPDLILELKERKIIRTKNIVGELGEYFAVKIFNETSKLPKLQMAPPSTANVDALSVNGHRYAIKSTSGSSTGVFASIPEENDVKQIYFEYLLVLLWNQDYQVKSLLQFDWKQFMKYRKIKKPENKYYFSLNSEIKKQAITIFEK